MAGDNETPELKVTRFDVHVDPPFVLFLWYISLAPVVLSYQTIWIWLLESTAVFGAYECPEFHVNLFAFSQV